jgi:hypothetical protein
VEDDRQRIVNTHGDTVLECRDSRGSLCSRCVDGVKQQCMDSYEQKP